MTDAAPPGTGGDQGGAGVSGSDLHRSGHVPLRPGRWRPRCCWQWLVRSDVRSSPNPTSHPPPVRPRAFRIRWFSLSFSLSRALSCSSMSPPPPSHTRSRHTRTPACCLLHRYCEIKNWHQSSKNVLAQRLWTDLKREAPSATVFVNGWWHGMYVPSRGVPHFHCVWLYSAQTRCISCTRCTNCIRSTCIVVPAHCPRQ